MAAIPSDAERAVCAAICRSGGLRAKEIAKLLDVSTETVDKVLYRSPLLKELCWQDGDYRWHGLVPQTRPHAGSGSLRAGTASRGIFWPSPRRNGSPSSKRAVTGWAGA